MHSVPEWFYVSVFISYFAENCNYVFYHKKIHTEILVEISDI